MHGYFSVTRPATERDCPSYCPSRSACDCENGELQFGSHNSIVAAAAETAASQDPGLGSQTGLSLGASWSSTLTYSRDMMRV
jgi:hypothetical protein